jgi:hypothetical protein
LDANPAVCVQVASKRAGFASKAVSRRRTAVTQSLPDSCTTRRLIRDADAFVDRPRHSNAESMLVHSLVSRLNRCSVQRRRNWPTGIEPNCFAFGSLEALWRAAPTSLARYLKDFFDRPLTPRTRPLNITDSPTTASRWLGCVFAAECRSSGHSISGRFAGERSGSRLVVRGWGVLL